MPIEETEEFDVEDADEVTGSGSAPVVGGADGLIVLGTGRLVHPVLGTYDYSVAPDEVVNLDAAAVVRPIWSHSQTVGGGVDALWPGHLRDVTVVERWMNGDTGAPMALARALLAMFTTPPVDPAVNFVVWSPNYITDASYRVALVDLRSGGEGFKLDLRLQRWGWTPQPLELEMRIIEEV